MNDTQNTAPSANSQLGAGTSNSPQNTGQQGIENTASNLQTVSTPNLFSGNTDVSITQVGDGNFVPFSADNTTTTTTAVSPPKPADHHYPIIAGAAVVVIGIIIISWLMSRKQKAY